MLGDAGHTEMPLQDGVTIGEDEGECVESRLEQFTFHSYVHACAVHQINTAAGILQVDLYVEGVKVSSGW